jgi:predicted ATP-grasp superfamily ATP-dependent carboligase
LICKPLMGFASFGVVRVDSDHALEEAIKQTSRKSRFIMGRYYSLEDDNTASEVLVQSYIPGSEIAIDGYVQRGNSYVLSVIDKPDISNGPFFEDRSHITPSRLDSSSMADIRVLVQSCVEALGLDDSPFHIEIRINEDQMYVLEIGARPGLIHSLRNSKGIDLISVTLALKLGKNPPVEPTWNRYAGSLCLSADKQGIFQGLKYLDDIKKDPRIVAVRQFAKPGQRVAPPPDVTGYIAIISVTADSYNEAMNAISNARRTLEVVIS